MSQFISLRPTRLGKTTQMLSLAAKEGATIICLRQSQCEQIQQQADKLGIKIKPPMTASGWARLRGIPGQNLGNVIPCEESKHAKT